MQIGADDLKIGSGLLRLMQMSLHPPHAVEIGEAKNGKQKVIANPAFPFCGFGTGLKTQSSRGSYLKVNLFSALFSFPLTIF